VAAAIGAFISWVTSLNASRTIMGRVPPTEGGVHQLVAQGRVIEAIRLLRTLRHIGLKEARDAVESLRQGRGLPSASSQPRRESVAVRDADVLRLVQTNDLIGAIKRYREMTGAGLLEAKAAIEQLKKGRK
jgi:ribosomal protein L7/L12